MAEKTLVIDGLELNYKGLFDVNGLLKKIDKNIVERGYSKGEKRREERITASGKEFSIELRPVKRKTDYEAVMIKIRIEITNLKDVEVMRNKVKTKMNQGNVHMLFDAWTTTDYEWRWEQKPLFYFLRNLVERITYKFHTDKFFSEVSDDTHFVYNNIKAYLELHGL